MTLVCVCVSLLCVLKMMHVKGVCQHHTRQLDSVHAATIYFNDIDIASYIASSAMLNAARACYVARFTVMCV